MLRKHVHHALIGHGGERWIAGAPTVMTTLVVFSSVYMYFLLCGDNTMSEFVQNSLHLFCLLIDLIRLKMVFQESEVRKVTLSFAGATCARFPHIKKNRSNLYMLIQMGRSTATMTSED